MMTKSPPLSPNRDVIAIIMGGGVGTRLFPLTKNRSKPAVSLGGKYRLVDIPISNCINSDLKRIFLLTQFNSASLHRHIQHGYRFDDYAGGFVQILAAQQTHTNPDWYQGTADAVRQNLDQFENYDHKYTLILSGDQLYRMDFRDLIQQHIESGADATVATIPVKKDAASSFGIMQINDKKEIVRFVEKPKGKELTPELKLAPSFINSLNIQTNDDLYLASMGIYLFNRKILKDSLSGTDADFGKHIIPKLINNFRVNSYIYHGYWEDIGTIRAFFEANLNLCEAIPKFNFFDVSAPIFCRPRFLPASKVIRSELDCALIAEGCVITDSKISHTVIGVRSRIQENCNISHCVIMGLDYFENDQDRQAAATQGLPAMGIGKNCTLEQVIVDKNARIGDNVTITRKESHKNFDGDNYYIRDGIVVVPKNAVIKSGTKI